MNDPSINTPSVIHRAKLRGVNNHIGSAVNRNFAMPRFSSLASQNAGQNVAGTSNPNNPLTRVKPLRPNILDAQEKMRTNELAQIRRKSGVKWVRVLEGRAGK